MKKIYFFIMAMFLAVMPLVFVGCGDDEDEAKDAILKVQVVFESDETIGVKNETVYLFNKPYDEITDYSESGAFETQKTNETGIATFELSDDLFFAETSKTITVAIEGENNNSIYEVLSIKRGETKTITLKSDGKPDTN